MHTGSVTKDPDQPVRIPIDKTLAREQYESDNNPVEVKTDNIIVKFQDHFGHLCGTVVGSEESIGDQERVGEINKILLLAGEKELPQDFLNWRLEDKRAYWNKLVWGRGFRNIIDKIAIAVEEGKID